MQNGPKQSPVDAVLFDLLMAVMNSLDSWAGAAGDRSAGMAWRDAVTSRMRSLGSYQPYERLVTDAAVELGLPAVAADDLVARWATMTPWPDASAISRLTVPYAFVTNCSTDLALLAARRSGLAPRFTLSAEEAGAFKPDPRVYRAACRRMGTQPERALFVAGSPYDAQGARDAGLEAILVVRRADHASPAAAIPAISSLRQALAGWLQDGPPRR